MDLIYECANNFMNLVNTKYHFVFVQNRKRHDIVLDFQPSDFRHATGLHHITDIAIEKNPMKLINAILYTVPSKISDRKLEKSKKYKAVSPYSGSVRERISDMRFLDSVWIQVTLCEYIKRNRLEVRLEPSILLKPTAVKYSKTCTYLFGKDKNRISM